MNHMIQIGQKFYLTDWMDTMLFFEKVRKFKFTTAAKHEYNPTRLDVMNFTMFFEKGKLSFLQIYNGSKTWILSQQTWCQRCTFMSQGIVIISLNDLILHRYDGVMWQHYLTELCNKASTWNHITNYLAV